MATSLRKPSNIQICVWISLIFVSLMYYYIKDENQLARFSFESRIRFVTEKIVNVEPEECIRTTKFETGVSTIICIKPYEDGHNLTDQVISKSIKDSGAWEGGIVNSVIRALEKFPHATFLDVGCNIGMFTLVVAALGRNVVAVDADPNNLELVRKCLGLINKQSNTRLIYNSVSDDYETLYPYNPWYLSNPGGTYMLTSQQVQEQNLTITLPSIESVKFRDILDIIPSKTIILKIDIEGYECKALQPEIIQNKLGKFIPFIFIEWIHLNNKENCPQFNAWVENFLEGGYISVDPGTMAETAWNISVIDLLWVHESVL